MAKFKIEGGHPIQGTFVPRGNKNAVLPMLAASLLTDQPVTLENIPLIEDVTVMLQLLEALGLEIELHGHTLTLCARLVNHTDLDPILCAKVRTSILLAGPLCARHGSATLYPPGGDIIGRRRIDTHIHGLSELGMKIEIDEAYHFQADRLVGRQIVLDEASVTATENILMAAVLAEGETILYNAACEPHVQDLAHLLNKMGASITGIGTNRLIIHGVKTLAGATHRVQPDYIEIGSFVTAAITTGGSLTIPQAGDPLTLNIMQRTFARLGVTWTLDKDTLIVPKQSSRRVAEDIANATPKIEDGIWPAFPSDLIISTACEYNSSSSVSRSAVEKESLLACAVISSI